LYAFVLVLIFFLIYFVCTIFLLIFKKIKKNKRIKNNKRKEKIVLVWVYGTI